MSSYFAVDALAQKTAFQSAATEADTQKRRADQKAVEATAAAGAAQREAIEATKQRAFARRLLYASNMNLAQRAWEDSDFRRMDQLLRQLIPQSGESDLRDWEWFYLQAQSHGQLRTLSGKPSFQRIAFSQNGLIVAAAGSQGVTIWDAVNGNELWTLPITGTTVALAFSNEARRLVVVGSSGLVTVFELETGEASTFTSNRGVQPTNVRSSIAAITPDGSVLAWIESDTVRLWDTATGDEKKVFKTFVNSVQNAVFSPDGKHIAMLGGKADSRMEGRFFNTPIRLSVIDISNGLEVTHLKRAYQGLFFLAYSGDGQQLALRQGPEEALFLDVETGSELFQNRATGLDPALSHNGRWLVTHNHNHKAATIWEAATGKEVRSIKHGGNMTGVMFSPDSRSIATFGPSDVKIWELDTHNVPFRTEYIAFCPDGLQCATEWPGRLHLWDLETDVGHTIAEAAEVRGPIAFSPVAGMMACGANQIKLFEIPAIKELWTTGEHDNQASRVRSIVFSPDGQLLASSHNGNFTTIWDTATGREVRVLRESESVREAKSLHDINNVRVGPSIAFSSDGRLIATGCASHGALVWDALTGTRIRSLLTDQFVDSVAFSPDGQTVAAGGSDGSIELWDVHGAESRTIKAHSSGVASVAFVPSGRRLASASSDATTKLWEIESGTELFSFSRRDGSIADVMLFSPNGRWLAIAGYESVRLFDSEITSEDKRTGLFLARDIVRLHPERNDAMTVIQGKTNWNKEVREAAQDFVRRHAAVDVDGATVARALVLQGALLIRSKQWTASADLFARAATTDPSDFRSAANAARLRLAGDDLDAYRGICRELLAQHRNARDIEALYWVTLACVAGEAAVENPEALVELASRGVELVNQTKKLACWTVLGAAQYRAGQLDAALDTLKKTTSVYDVLALANPRGVPFEARLDHLTCLTFLTLANHARGRDDEARKTRTFLEKTINQLRGLSLPSDEEYALRDLSIVLARRALVELSIPEEATDE